MAKFKEGRKSSFDQIKNVADFASSAIFGLGVQKVFDVAVCNMEVNCTICKPPMRFQSQGGLGNFDL